MNKRKFTIVALLVIAIVGVIRFKENRKLLSETNNIEKTSNIKTDVKKEIPTFKNNVKGKPKIIDLGSKTCVPCKMMEPILEELKKNYSDCFETEFIDINANELNHQVAMSYSINVIPTQIFMDSEGSELKRHVGYISKEDILTIWRELGYECSKDMD